MDYQEYYKKNINKRISFIKKFNYFYKLLGDEINRVIETNSTLILFSAGHSKLVEHINFQKVYISEIVKDFISHISIDKNKISIIENLSLNSIKNKHIDDVIITSLEYAEDPIKLLKYINKNVGSDCKINIITRIFLEFCFKFLKNLISNLSILDAI